MLVLPTEWCACLPLMPSLRIGSCGMNGRPFVCRGLAAEALDDGRILVLLSESVAPKVVGALRETGQVAVLANSPRTNRTLHMKGRDARVEAGRAEYTRMLSRQRATLASEIAEIDGFADAPFIELWYRAADAGLAAVHFSLSGAWDQTPGPQAGRPLELESTL